ncbi:ABC transporter permease [Stenoxybacter acetivorans]|uniref:ABC transporter permease n=1 Tax=Stenoxybacter acetivorans TaxID=422441 RepID=UPI00055A9530|nr:iron export ABC transporter permease subunit FetB [Stenoxybacter acetivorans]
MHAANYVSVADLAIASVLVLISAAISLWLKLGLTQRIAVAAVRTVVQLSLVGLVLKWVFSANQWYWVVGIVMLMTVIAGISARSHSAWIYRGMTQDALSSVWLSSWLVAAIGLFLVLHVRPWYEPQYVIPIIGMILGNSLTGISLCLDRLTQDLYSRRGHVEMLLSLGASAWEAYRDTARRAVISGMLPTINSMSVVGLVSLPGMMTGQILAGGAPDQAVRYQVVMLFVICAGSALGCMLCALLVFRRLFNNSGQFCTWRLYSNKPQ